MVDVDLSLKSNWHHGISLVKKGSGGPLALLESERVSVLVNRLSELLYLTSTCIDASSTAPINMRIAQPCKPTYRLVPRVETCCRREYYETDDEGEVVYVR